MKQISIAAAVLGAALMLAVPAAAQVMPAPQTQNGITFVTGGVGQERAAAFRQVASDYNLRATFTAPGGAFMANVKVDLQDAQGKTLVSTITEGPFFFARVPAGTYDLTASYGEQTVQRRLLVNPGGAATTEVTFIVPVGK
jgi:hypothetical protein